jgi:general secretion pathway protein M
MAGPILQMNERERKLVGVLAVVGAIVLLCAVPFGINLYIRSEHADNDELRQALSDVQDARSRVRERQARKDLVTARYSHKAPPLAGFLEQTARVQKLEVTESNPLPDVPHGKHFVEHATNVHLKKAGMLPVAKFLESIERSGYPVALTRLNIRKRAGEADSYDIEVGVSSFDRIEGPPAPSGSSKP